MRKLFKIGLALGILLIVGLAAFVFWGLNPAPPMDEALAAMESTETVSVQSGRWLVFQPAQGTPTRGLILYPGGHVDARAYAPAAHQIAGNGFLVVIVPMPLNLAVLGINEGGEVMAAYPAINQWVIAGHSLGGSMAANYADSHPGALAGIVLWASYPAKGDDLSDQAIEALSIYGTQDGLATQDDIQASQPLLPQDTIWLPIEGGNHGQFGWYGPQSGDNQPTISREDQQEKVVRATLDFLKKIGSAQ
jgi:hypothetical protein